jgi:hypothetical protein
MFDAKLKHDGAEIVFFNNKRKDNKMDIPLHLASASVNAQSFRNRNKNIGNIENFF